MRGTPIKLPETHVDRSGIRWMEPGSIGYAVPWAVMVDRDGNMWIHGGYPVSPYRGGTVQMLVKRTEDGVQVGRRSMGVYTVPYIGSEEEDMLPIVGLIEEI